MGGNHIVVFDDRIADNKKCAGIFLLPSHVRRASIELVSAQCGRTIRSVHDDKTVQATYRTFCDHNP